MKANHQPTTRPSFNYEVHYPRLVPTSRMFLFRFNASDVAPVGLNCCPLLKGLLNLRRRKLLSAVEADAILEQARQLVAISAGRPK